MLYLRFTEFDLPCDCNDCDMMRRLSRFSMQTITEEHRTLANQRSVNKHFDHDHFVINKQYKRFVNYRQRKVTVQLNNGDKFEVIRYASLNYDTDSLRIAMLMWKEVIKHGSRYSLSDYPHGWSYYHTLLPNPWMVKHFWMWEVYLREASPSWFEQFKQPDHFHLRDYTSDRCREIHRFYNDPRLRGVDATEPIEWSDSVPFKSLHLPDGPYDYQTVYRLGGYKRLPSFFYNY